jgi:hypothetical protein
VSAAPDSPATTPADGGVHASGGGSAQSTGPAVASSDNCPLCGTLLADEQEWCLRCGAAARTRLGPPPSRKAPIAALAIVATLSLGVLAASLVKLASNSTPVAKTVTVSTSPNAPTQNLDVARVALSIEQTLLAKRHLHSKVSCPSEVPQEAGRTFTCTATIEGGRAAPFRVTEQNDFGSVTFVGE